jgi:hypothetical protein
MKTVSDFASAMQKVSGVSDEVINDAMQIGLQMVYLLRILNENKSCNGYECDIWNRFKTNIEMLAKAQEGQTGQLTKLLPNMKEAKKMGWHLVDVLGTIDGKDKRRSCSDW